MLASRVGGLSELVEDRANGRLCDVDDLDCFVEALRWCLDDRERLLTMKQASRTRAEPFNIENIARRYENVFEEITDRAVY